MSPDKKNQNNPNNYDFILNQHPENPTVAKKKTSKKVIVLVVLVVVAVVAIGVSALLSANQNVQQTAATEYSAEQVSQASNVVEDFFEKVAAGDTDGAYALFSNPAALSKEEFTSEAIPFLNRLDISTCQPVENANGVVDEIDNITQTYACTVKANGNQVELQFSIDSTESGQTSIYGYFIVVGDEND